MVAQFSALAESADVVQAELTASQLLGTWWTTAPSEVDVIGGDVIDHATRVGTAGALGLVTGLAAVTTGDLAAKATAAARTLTDAGVALPPWARSLGKAVPGDCWCWGDVFGDRLTVHCEFDGPMGPHAIGVLINRTLASDFAEEAWATSEPQETLADIRRSLGGDPDLYEIRRIDQTEAHQLIAQAFRTTDVRQMKRSAAEDLPRFRAVVLARSRLLPDPAVPVVPTAAEQRKLVNEFVTDTGFASTGAARRCVDKYVEFCCDMDSPDPLRVSPAVVALFLLETAEEPIDLAEAEALPDAVVAFVRWAAARRGLSDLAVKRVMSHIEDAAARFCDAGVASIELPLPRSDSYIVRVDLDEYEVTLSELAPNPGAKLTYAYDDSTHRITVEKFERRNPYEPLACLDGSGGAFDVAAINNSLREAMTIT